MPTQLKSRCPHCKAIVKAKESHVGQRVRCPACKQAFVVDSVETSSGSTSLEPARPTTETIAAAASDTDDIAGGKPGPCTSQGAALSSLGRFELRELLGQGAFGRVYKAYDPQLDRYIALKVPTFGPDDNQKIQRFTTEAKAAAKLRHPSIVPTHESGQIGGQYYIAAQFVAGQPLSKRIKENPPDFRQSAEWVRQLANALAYAHAEGVVHRDIKPDNIMLDAKGVPQIMDFGLAKRLNEDSAMTTDGSILGTPAYMAPEQAKGKMAEVGPQSDQYSLGAVLYELLTGKRPFDGQPHSVIAQVIAVDPPSPRTLNREIPSDLEAICQIAMNKAPGERYPSCSELSNDIALWLGGFETQARPLTPVERGWRWCRRNAVVAGLLAAVLVLAIFALGTTSTLVWTFANQNAHNAHTAKIGKSPLDESLTPRTLRPEASNGASDAFRPPEVANETLSEDANPVVNLGESASAETTTAGQQSNIPPVKSGTLTGRDIAAVEALYAEAETYQKRVAEDPASIRLAAERYHQAGLLGHAGAQFKLGIMYTNGQGVTKDDEEAVRWYQKAAEQGHVLAQNNLGSRYRTGRGVARNDVEAAKWYRKAAEQGNASAQNNLGFAYSKGQGVSQDNGKAVEWYRKAAEQGNADAQYNLGLKYEKGDGVAQDDEQAVEWYRKAADQDHAAAQFKLGFMYGNGHGVMEDGAAAVEWYRKAADQNHAVAQYNLGLRYSSGRGVPKDDVEAVKWYRKAAEQNHSTAQYQLGNMYEFGRGVAKDHEEAVKWWRKSEGKTTTGPNVN